MAIGLTRGLWLICVVGVNSAALGATVAPKDARIREQGNLQKDGSFSFWTRGVLGDWFVAPKAGPVTLSVMASGRTLGGEPPIAAVELVPADGPAREVGRLAVASSRRAEHRLTFPVARGFFGLRLRHTNRVAGPERGQLRHLVVKVLRVEGASRSPKGLTEHVFFGDGEHKSGPASGAAVTVEAGELRVTIDPRTAVWSAEHAQRGLGVSGVRPLFLVQDLPIEPARCEVGHTVSGAPDDRYGPCTKVVMDYRRPGALDWRYTLRVGREQPQVVVTVDFVNRTRRPLVVSRVAGAVASGVSAGGPATGWTAIADRKRFCEPYETVDAGSLEQLEGWWYTAVKNRGTGRSVLFGNLTNRKGLGRFLMLPGGRTSVRVAAYNDYESIRIPPGASVAGEALLVHFGRRGTDSLDRFGDLVARAHDIDLMKQHPIDPYSAEHLSLFGTWNGYGSGVVRGFLYKHDKAKYAKPFMDPKWTRANRAMIKTLGLHHYGYAPLRPVKVKGAPSPLARRYGNPDFWFKAAQEIAKAHPEYYVDGRIDFSNPAVQAFERQRVARAFQDKTRIVRYGWDFADRWARLPGQHDPFLTSADTYRIAMGIWREAARRHPPGAYGFVWMNAVGLSYDTCDVIHIGADSDQGYYGRGCTFTQGLTRQISGRYFYNGRVWWNSPDSFHVYCGGLYSYAQAKVHASFCALSGNLVHLAEPFTDQNTPEERLEIVRRVCPTTPDVATAVDVFEHNPARLWSMPVRRPFGAWRVVGLFNVDYKKHGRPITQRVALADLGLSPEREYVVYEFWTRKLLGVVKNAFTRTLAAPDCEIYSIVEKRDRPVLVSTSRHVRHMAYDVLDVRWDARRRVLSGTSKVVQRDPYELRVFAPAGYVPRQATAEGLEPTLAADGRLVTVGFTSPTSRDVAWSIAFGLSARNAP